MFSLDNYVENKFHMKDNEIYELVYQTPEYSLCIKHPIIMSEEPETSIDSRIITTKYFNTYYPIIEHTSPTINFKQRKILIDKILNVLYPEN